MTKPTNLVTVDKPEDAGTVDQAEAEVTAARHRSTGTRWPWAPCAVAP